MVAAATVHAQTTKRKTFIFAEDKSAANDSVEYLFKTERITGPVRPIL
jgi:hypothetical protein